jgi:cytochrome c oxidase cbb3-type subunit 4
VDWGNLWGLYTLLMLVVFVGIAVWAWSGKRSKAFKEAAEIPLLDEAPHRDTPPARSKEKEHD